MLVLKSVLESGRVEYTVREIEPLPACLSLHNWQNRCTKRFSNSSRCRCWLVARLVDGVEQLEFLKLAKLANRLLLLNGLSVGDGVSQHC